MNTQPNEIEAVGAVAVQAIAAVAGSQLITLDPAKYVAEVFKPFNDKFAILKAEADTITPDASTTAGMEIAVKYRAAFRDDVRIAGEKARADRKAPILQIGKLLDSKYRDLAEAVAPYEAKFHDAIKAEEKRKDELKKAEAERQEKIRLRVSGIRDLPLNAVGKSAVEVGDMIAALEADEPDESFGILLDAATTARAEVLAKLASVHAAAVANEEEAARIAAERAELAQLREAAAERARLTQIETDRIAAAQKAEADRLAALAAEQEAAALRERETAAAKLKQEAEAQAEANRKAQAEIDRQRQELATQQAAALAEREAAERVRVAAETKAQLEQKAASASSERQVGERASSAAATNFDADARAAALADHGHLTDLANEQTAMAPALELAAAKTSPEGAELSPAAAELFDQEGAANFERAHTPPSLRLGQIGDRLGFTVTADFLLSLGFAPAATDKAAKLYHEIDFARICASIQRHIGAVQAKYAA